MRHKIMFGVAAAALAISSAAFAQAQFGTAAEAKAMLDKAVAAVKADKGKALTAFAGGTDGFKDRDLYPFCFNAGDGVTVAGPASVMGKDVRTIKDPTGKTFGEDLFKGAQEGKVTEVAYMFPRPGQTEPSAKISFVTKVGDLGCGVGYYK
jgi:signal transduction histidine kinase